MCGGARSARRSPPRRMDMSPAHCLYVALLLCPAVRPAEPCGAPRPGAVSAEPLVLCRACGHELASGADVHFVPSGLALSTRNDTLLGGRRVTVQLLENPGGHRFEVLTFRRADVTPHWPAEERFSWYRSFAWSAATCPRCRVHLGWAFQPSSWPDTVPKTRFDESAHTFVALITPRLLPEDFASSLLITPKSFTS